MLRALFAILIATLLSACASVPMMGLKEDQEAKEFKSAAGKARI